MLGFNRRLLFKILAATLCVVGVTSLLLIYFIPAPPSKITIGTAFKGGVFEYYGQRYQQVFARAHVNLDVRLTNGGTENLQLLDDPDSGVQIGFVGGGVSDGKHHPGLVSLGTISYLPCWIFYSSTEPIDRLSQLQGKRIAVGPVGSGIRYQAERILGIAGITSETATLLPFAGDNAVDALKDGKVDVVWNVSTPDAPNVQALLRNPRVRLMSIPRAEAFTRIFPDLVRLVLPEGVIEFDRNIPPVDVTLIAVTNRLLIRSDLHPDIVYLLLQTMVEVHGQPGLFQRTGEFPTQTDPEYPMAASAADFYKNGPSFLQRHLPLWMVTHVQRLLALLLAGGAIVFPIFSFAPKLFRSFVVYRLGSMYRRLRVIEASLQKDVTISEVSALEAELASVNRAIHLLGVPKQHSDLFFSIKSHLDLVRIDLGLRRAELQSQMTKAV
jgi:TRAP transporter TAXI family solute receptor